MADLITLPEAETHLAATGRETDLDAAGTEISTCITAASAMVEGYMGPVIIASFTDTFYGVASRQSLILSNVPVVTVTSVTSALYGTTTATYLTAAVQAEATTGLVRVLDGTYLSGDITVVYTAGRVAAVGNVPQEIKKATAVTVAHLWSTQRGGASFRPSFVGGEDEPQGNFLPSFALPYMAEQLLLPWGRKAPAVA